MKRFKIFLKNIWAEIGDGIKGFALVVAAITAFYQVSKWVGVTFIPDPDYGDQVFGGMMITAIGLVICGVLIFCLITLILFLKEQWDKSAPK